MAAQECIRLQGAEQHNLKNIDVEIPKGKLTVITGVSGTGKSSLARHTLFAEGQRRYIESFSPYTRQFLERMPRPAFTQLKGMQAAIAIQAVNSVTTSRSTVATLSELSDGFKLLFGHLATPHCLQCAAPLKAHTLKSALRLLEETLPEKGVVCFTFRYQGPREQAESYLSSQGFSTLHACRQHAPP